MLPVCVWWCGGGVWVRWSCCRAVRQVGCAACAFRRRKTGPFFSSEDPAVAVCLAAEVNGHNTDGNAAPNRRDGRAERSAYANGMQTGGGGNLLAIDARVYTKPGRRRYTASGRSHTRSHARPQLAYTRRGRRRATRIEPPASETGTASFPLTIAHGITCLGRTSIARVHPCR